MDDKPDLDNPELPSRSEIEMYLTHQIEKETMRAQIALHRLESGKITDTGERLLATARHHSMMARRRVFMDIFQFVTGEYHPDRFSDIPRWSEQDEEPGHADLRR